MLLHCPSLRLIDASLGELPHQTLPPLPLDAALLGCFNPT